jgi:hypothetical protein
LPGVSDAAGNGAWGGLSALVDFNRTLTQPVGLGWYGVAPLALVRLWKRTTYLDLQQELFGREEIVESFIQATASTGSWRTNQVRPIDLSYVDFGLIP